MYILNNYKIYYLILYLLMTIIIKYEININIDILNSLVSYIFSVSYVGG